MFVVFSEVNASGFQEELSCHSSVNNYINKHIMTSLGDRKCTCYIVNIISSEVKSFLLHIIENRIQIDLYIIYSAEEHKFNLTIICLKKFNFSVEHLVTDSHRN